MIQRYVEVKDLRKVKKKKDEIVVVSYPAPYKNVSGKKSDKKIKEAYKDAQKGKCKLLVWREVDEPNPYI